MEEENKIAKLKELAEGVAKGNINLSVIRAVKTLENNIVSTGELSAEFKTLRQDYNKNIAYWANKNIDIREFLDNTGYTLNKAESTERWPKYVKGERQVLLTEGNTVIDVKSGESMNLFKFVNAEYFKDNPKMSDTAHFVNQIYKHAGGTSMLHNITEKKGKKENIFNVQKAVKEFKLSDYRIEPLNDDNIFLKKRGIKKETLEDRIFSGTILQGNKAMMNSEYNNVIYPFRQHPGEKAEDMKTLLQQYGKKIDVNGNQVDKIFAAGEGKTASLWMSNPPPAGVKYVQVMENPLDCLSHYQLYKPQHTLYVATGGTPSSGQLELVDKLCKEYKAQPVLSFDRDMAGYRFDAMYLAHRAPDKVHLSGAGDSVNVTFKNLSEVCHRNLVTGLEKNGVAFEAAAGTITATAADEKQMQLLVNVANIHALPRRIDIDKAKYKDYNDDLRLNIRQPELHKSLEINTLNMKI
ncbi:MAG: toprim domain-containing protein [Tannerella sp.]|jgi:hypothetical protein|nr:toprim domain-containing protein [Tannerella sp.]